MEGLRFAAVCRLMKTGEFSFILKPSDIHGVGVFTTHAIPAGTRLRLFARSDVARYKHSVPKLFDRYVVVVDAPRIMCPQDFGRMSVGWYLNHSDDSNTKIVGNYQYVAARDIQADEEITIDYRELEPSPLE